MTAFFVIVSSKGPRCFKLKISDAGQNGPFARDIH